MRAKTLRASDRYLPGACADYTQLRLFFDLLHPYRRVLDWKGGIDMNENWTNLGMPPFGRTAEIMRAEQWAPRMCDAAAAAVWAHGGGGLPDRAIDPGPDIGGRFAFRA